MASDIHARAQQVGALVIGGDYQGLGIVRSLGRRSIPVGIVDDEKSIASYSRYASFAERVASLGDAANTAGILLDIGRRRKLRGWLLYPTRDETVRALSQYRDQLKQFFRVPTPAWDSIRWIVDKRNTYALARRLGISIPRTESVGCPEDLDQFEHQFPW